MLNHAGGVEMENIVPQGVEIQHVFPWIAEAPLPMVFLPTACLRLTPTAAVMVPVTAAVAAAVADRTIGAGSSPAPD